MGAEKIRKIITELTRIRNELRELVSEGGTATGGGMASAGGVTTGGRGTASSGRTSVGGDPLDEILGALPPRNNNAASLNPEDEDVIVVDVSLPVSNRADSQVTPEVPQILSPEGSKAPVDLSKAPADEPPPTAGEKDAKRYPKNPPPRKRK